ncbi:MAG: hypothetical protein U9N61_08280, partial [Euryarchaeota archaeon]|nr:hypothetical protein [Euryarchaeota archaeon]
MMGWFRRLFGTTKDKDTFFTDEGGTPAVPSVAVVAKIHDKWPNLIWGTHIWLADSKYFLPTKRALQMLLNSSPVA